MNFPLIDCVVLAAYLIISFVAGICANKILKSSNKSADGYFLAGRSMPGWLTGISNAVTAMNADVAPAYVGVTLAAGLPVCWFYFSRFSLGVLLAGLLFFARWRQLGVSTGPEFFSLRFGGNCGSFVRSYSSISSVLLGIIPWTGAGLLGIHMIFSNFFGYTDKLTTLVIILPLLLIYVWVSGFAGVLVTDFIQTLVIVVSSIFICGAVLYHFGGPAELAAAVSNAFPAEQSERILSIWPQQGNPVVSPALVLIWFFLCSCGAGGSVGIEGQRVISCKNTGEAIKVSIWTQAGLFVMLLLLTLPALGLLADFPELHQASPQERESAYSILINNYLPSGFKGLTLAALAAAVMSTVSSHLSYGAQTIVNDVLQPIFKISDDKKVWAGRMVMVGMMLLSVLVVYLSDSLLGIAITLLGLFGSSALIGWGYWWYWRINFCSWVASTIGGPCIYFIGKTLLSRWQFWAEQKALSVTHAQMMDVYWALASMFLTTAFVLLVTFLTRPEKPEVLMNFYKRARPMGYWRPVQDMLRERGELREEPKHLILGGVFTAVMGAVWINSFVMALSKAYIGEYLDAFLFGIAAVVFAWFFKRFFNWQLRRLE